MAGEFAVYTSLAVGGKRNRPTKPETREQIIARNSSRVQTRIDTLISF